SLNLIIYELCRFIPAYKAGLSRHLPVKPATTKSTKNYHEDHEKLPQSLPREKQKEFLMGLVTSKVRMMVNGTPILPTLLMGG
ncbi:MAG: hypothetical protein V3R78_07255, partial [Thermodesulfobacteriota bacterium]